MNLDVRIAADGSLNFLTPSQQVVASLNPQAVVVLNNLALAPAQTPVSQHVQAIVRQLTAEVEATARLGLTSLTDDGTVELTDAGQRLISWLMSDWEGWAVYIRRVAISAGSAWGWRIEYSAPHVDPL